MGCCESTEESSYFDYDQGIQAVQQSQPTRIVRPVQTSGPYFGKYKCQSCKRHWVSRFCWPDKYQICKGCRAKIYPYTHRELISDDFEGETDKSKEHQSELCQMCQQRGESCVKKINLRRQ